jgi:hypothetical protein
MTIETMIATAVDLAARAWNANFELRNQFKPMGSSAHPLLGNGNVGTLLRLIHKKRQILCFTPPAGDHMLAHAVLDENDYYNTPTRKFAARQTILLAPGCFTDGVKRAVSFRYASAKDIGSVDADQMRAILLLHEARHLYTLIGHGADPANHDPSWNDYILWTGFLGQRVARTVWG